MNKALSTIVVSLALVVGVAPLATATDLPWNPCNDPASVADLSTAEGDWAPRETSCSVTFGAGAPRDFVTMLEGAADFLIDTVAALEVQAVADGAQIRAQHDRILRLRAKVQHERRRANREHRTILRLREALAEQG